MDYGNKTHIDADYVAWQTSVRLAAHAMDPPPVEAPVSPANSLDELYAVDGEAFVHLVFKTFVDRPPTESELSRLAGDLGEGVSKSVVAARVRYSAEASAKPQQLNLKKTCWIDRLCRIPVAGNLFNWAYTLLTVTGIKRSLHRQHQAIATLRAELNHLKAYIRKTNQAIVDDIVYAEEIHKHDFHALLHQEIASLRDRQKLLDDALSAAESSTSSISNPPDTAAGQVDDEFYIAFENHFRGAETVIRERLAYYLPLLEDKLPAAKPSVKVADIGCGRGEWIRLLGENGYTATGVDMNERNIMHCAGNGLDVVQADGISWLRESPSQSFELITAFHLIEHLTLAQLNSLLVEALRSLKPGGLIILETPNPENLVTAANRFYTDPSHRHPLPPDLMEFILKYRGYTQIEIHRLHPAAEKLEGESQLTEKLNELLYGPQDYALVARKP